MHPVPWKECTHEGEGGVGAIYTLGGGNEVA